MVISPSAGPEVGPSEQPSPVDALRLVVVSDGPDATRAVGRALAPWLATGDVVVLTGDLGAGKTCLTQGIGAGMGIDRRITSPTFTLANRYPAPEPDDRIMHHLDVYRLGSAADALDLDLPELQESGVVVIEWGEQIAAALGPDAIMVTLRFDGDSDNRRLITFALPPSLGGPRADDLGRRLSEWTVDGTDG